MLPAQLGPTLAYTIIYAFKGIGDADLTCRSAQTDCKPIGAASVVLRARALEVVSQLAAINWKDSAIDVFAFFARQPSH